MIFSRKDQALLQLAETGYYLQDASEEKRLEALENTLHVHQYVLVDKMELLNLRMRADMKESNPLAAFGMMFCAISGAVVGLVGGMLLS